MHLNKQDADRFYNIWFPLLHYVNQKKKLVASFPEKRVAGVSLLDVLPLKEALWENDELREAFIAENPANLSNRDLDLVKSWKYRVMDNFFIFRHLKKYSVFLSTTSPTRAYGVVGLMGSVEETVGSNLPMYVKTVLIPFEQHITYDSIISPYSVLFGPGIRSDLERSYRAIQEREGIITTLPPITQPNIKEIRGSNRKVLAAFQKALGQDGLSPKMILEHTANITAYAEEFLMSQNPPVLLRDIDRNHLELYLDSGKVNLVSLKRFVRFLRDTFRMDYDKAEDLLNFLKGKR